MIENIITGVVLTSICVLGILGNSVTLLVLNSNHQMRNQPINLYLTVLALFDNGVLFNAILMLGIPGIYKLMHGSTHHTFPNEDSGLSFVSEDTFSPSPTSGRTFRLQRELSDFLAAIPDTSSSYSPVESQPSPTTSASAMLISASSPLSLAPSETLVASVFAHDLNLAAAASSPSQSTLRTSYTAILQADNYSPVPPVRSSFTASSSASSRVSLSSPSVPLLRVPSLQSYASHPASLTTRLRSGKRRRRRRGIESNGFSRLFNFQTPFSSSVITSSLNQNESHNDSHPESKVKDSTIMPLTSSSKALNSTFEALTPESLQSQAKISDFSESALTNPWNKTLIEEWDILSELINPWKSSVFGLNRSAGPYTSSPDPHHSDHQQSPSAASMTSSVRVQRKKDSLLYHEPLRVLEASAIRQQQQQHQQDASGYKSIESGLAESGLLEEAGLFAGDELILAPTEDDMDLMSGNSSSVSEGPLHLYIQFVYPLALISQTGSIWTTCLITAERYFAIAHPLRALTLSTRKRATWALITMSILAVVYNLPRFAEVEIVGVTEDAPVKNIILPSELRNNRVYYWVYYICIYLALLYIIPLTLLSVLNTKIYLAIKRANRDRSSLTQNQESEMNIATMLVMLVTIFIACNLPAFVVNCLELVHDSTYFHMAMIFSNFLVCLNSSVNFVIYCTFGKKFRERLHETFCCSSGRLPRRSTPIRNRKTSIVAETLV